MVDLKRDKYIIVEIIPTNSNSDKGFIAQISALKLEGIKLLDRFDYRVEEKLIESNDIKGSDGKTARKMIIENLKEGLKIETPSEGDYEY